MWKTFGERTIICVARGTRYLAAVWQAVWEEWDGDQKIGKGPT
jgi:hypothetical protein